jgi:site-specific recombinase XerD
MKSTKSKQFTITAYHISAYLAHLADAERAAATLEKYGRSVRVFAAWLEGGAVTKESVIEYKQQLSETHAASSVNTTIAALNGFFAFRGWNIKIKPLKIQRRTFLPEERELSRAEYERLLQAAKAADNERLHLVMQTICSTGIRVGELPFITVEAISSGRAEITNKGKTRRLILPEKLKKLLRSYAKKQGIGSGCIFITKNGKPLDRKNIWADMKKLCAAAKVLESKVFPHSLRHLFARCFYAVEKDIMRLADILGHADVKTTRLYVMESGMEHQKRVDQLGLVMNL